MFVCGCEQIHDNVDEGNRKNLRYHGLLGKGLDSSDPFWEPKRIWSSGKDAHEKGY